MNNAKTKLQELGFTSGHVQLLTVAVAVFAVLFVAKSGMNIKTMFVKADQKAAPTMTYEDALAQAKAQYNQTDSSDDSNASAQINNDQIALLDRSSEVDGKVLGDAIGIGEIPDADQLLLPEISNSITTNNISTDNPQTRSAFVQASQQIESSANTTSLLADLNSSDPAVLRNSASGWNWTVNALSKVPVPPSLQKYQKSKLIYYSVIMNIAKTFAGDKSNTDFALLTKAMLSYSQKMDSLTSDLNQTYNLNL